EPVRESRPAELGGERRVLGPEVVVRAAVEPEIGVCASERGSRGGERECGTVRLKERPLVPEDGADVVRAFVARPALEYAELAGVMEADVERAVAALRQPGEAPSASRADRPVPLVDRAHDVPGQERLPGAVRR